jgi:hypothetical protein
VKINKSKLLLLSLSVTLFFGISLANAGKIAVSGYTVAEAECLAEDGKISELGELICRCCSIPHGVYISDDGHSCIKNRSEVVYNFVVEVLKAIPMNKLMMLINYLKKNITINKLMISQANDISKRIELKTLKTFCIACVCYSNRLMNEKSCDKFTCDYLTSLFQHINERPNDLVKLVKEVQDAQKAIMKVVSRQRIF